MKERERTNAGNDIQKLPTIKQKTLPKPIKNIAYFSIGKRTITIQKT
jgi:hypothetical protein